MLMSHYPLFQSVSHPLLNRCKKIKLLITDVDGVLSDGLIYLGNQGEELKAFHVHDGFGIKALLNSEIQVAVITGRSSKIVSNRMESLGVQMVYQGQTDKCLALFDLQHKLQLDLSEIAYIGDDLVDLAVMQQVGLAVAVHNAHPLLAPHAHYITQKSGGYGAVRELADLLLYAQNKLESAQGYAI